MSIRFFAIITMITFELNTFFNFVTQIIVPKKVVCLILSLEFLVSYSKKMEMEQKTESKTGTIHKIILKWLSRPSSFLSKRQNVSITSFMFPADDFSYIKLRKIVEIPQILF